MKSLRSHLVRFVLLAVGVAGCNSILDNEPGTLQETSSPTDVDTNQPSQPPATSGSSTTGGVVVTPPTPPTATGECTDGKVLCAGQCVSKDDPNYGCGSCTPCAITRGTAQCVAGACAIKACDRGYSDCNAQPTDGCETDLAKATSCGSCNAVCPAATPVCAPTGETFQCSTGCAPAAPLLCGTECVDPLTSKNHCGGCGIACPAVANAESTCGLGTCGFTCHPEFHKCTDRCAPANDVTACGAACTVCPVPANAAATCTGEACGFTCAAGFADCNALPGDGCESASASDPLNCGGCGINCNGGTCTNGVCTPPDAGAPPP